MCLNAGYPCDCLTTGALCEPCRITAKDRETEGPHTSVSGGSEGPLANSLSVEAAKQTGPASGAVKERCRSWWWLSGFIAVNLLMLGGALVSGSAFNNVAINSAHLQVYLITLILSTTCWMLYYKCYTYKKDNAVLYKDEHAGPVWLRAGLVLFGILSLIMNLFKIASYVGHLHCDSVISVVFPVAQFVFITVQTYFLWTHAKDCVQLQKKRTCCGLMITLSTNLILWMTFISEESVHRTVIPEDINATKVTAQNVSTRGYEDEQCTCSYSSCLIFKSAYYYLYPFNIEYSLFASAMVYVIWKNVGRVAEERSHHIKQFHIKDALLGLSVGLPLVVAGLATFVVYEAQIATGKMKEQALMMYFTTNIVIVGLMSVATAAGCVIYKLDPRDIVSAKNPTRKLDVRLLVSASLGQFTLSYFSIVAMVATGAEGFLNSLSLALGMLTVIQLGLQNLFIVEGLHREPYHENRPAPVFANPYALQECWSKNGIPEVPGRTGVGRDGKPRPVLDGLVVEIGAHNCLRPHAYDPRRKLTWKRRVLKEVCVFLLLGNVILWIMPAFGARPQFDHTTEIDFFKFTLWAAVVNLGLPFGIFYRMHSVASLFEVFLTS